MTLNCNEAPSSCESRCNGDSLIVCSDGVETTTFCSQGCNASTLQCNETCMSRCVEDTLILCDQYGTFETVSCEYGCNETALQCNENVKEPCVEQCNNNVLTLCDSNGNPVSADCGSKKCNLMTRSCEIELNPVPSGQNNTDGAECDISTFVEHCDGNTAVYCLYNYNEKGEIYYEVIHEPCGDIHSCLSVRDGAGRNYSNCIKPADTCSKENLTEFECGVDEEDYVFQSKYYCRYWSDGLLHWAYEDRESTYCSTACDTRSPCQFNSCRNGSSPSCSGNLAITCYNEMGTSNYYYYAMDCGNAKCSIDRDYAYCNGRYW